FPIDEASLSYLARIGRPPGHIALVEAYAKAAGLWFDPQAELRFTREVTIDLDTLGPSVAGPRRPQDRMAAGSTRSAFTPPLAAGPEPVPDGAVVIAAITSCTNTSDASLLAAAGVLARKANALGLRP